MSIATNSESQSPPGGPSGPHTVHFSDVKEAVEAESGRFEFFKQMLAIGLGGVAGLAAVFTEQDKIPEGAFARAAVGLFALCSLVTAAASAAGIGIYANLLKRTRELTKTGSGSPERATSERKIVKCENGILNSAKWALVASFIAALSLVIFAGIRLFSHDDIGPNAAMDLARQAIRLQPGQPTPVALEHFQAIGQSYIVTYVTDQNQTRYTATVSRAKNELVEITKP